MKPGNLWIRFTHLSQARWVPGSTTSVVGLTLTWSPSCTELRLGEMESGGHHHTLVSGWTAGYPLPKVAETHQEHDPHPFL